MDRFYATPERADKEDLERQKLSLLSNVFLMELINSVPYIITILNEYRQVILYNNALSEQLGIKNFQALFGYRPGEVLQCVHSHELSGGCGSSEHCRYCGAVRTIIASLKENRMITNECRIFAEIDGTETAYDFRVSVKPFIWENERYLILSLTDISGEKRRRMLERIFFHDILNTAGNMKNLVELLSGSADPGHKEEFLQILQNLSSELVEEIEAQRQITVAESGELIPKIESVNSKEIVESVISQLKNHSSANRDVKISGHAESIQFLSDRSMITRIIKNMVINAVEASPGSEEISVKAHGQGSIVRFEVRNPAFIPRDVQLQIFNRSFSTKSMDRGFGTYSMKLLGERYLKGKVYFVTDKTRGTVFYFDMPV
jgi:signal transduction histidine kinase